MRQRARRVAAATGSARVASTGNARAVAPGRSPRVAVATSGGRDSTALLHATVRAGAALGIEVLALHVNHGLMADADRWQAQLRRQCRRWGVPLQVLQLEGGPASGDSTEAWARRERYCALAQAAKDHGCSLVLLAQHRRDQAETFLLQALRGSGPAGLAAMPRRAERAGITWARPWRDAPREAIESYLRRHRLSFVDDPSNADPRFARARLRALWQGLTTAFNDAEQTLSAAAGRAAEAAHALDEWVEADLATVADAQGLNLPRWRSLSRARRGLVLRTWLARTLAKPAPESLVRRLLDELPACVSARWPAPGGELRAYRNTLGFAGRADKIEAPPTARAVVLRLELDPRCTRQLRVPGWGGAMQLEPAREGGAATERLRSVIARAREGGERFSLAPGAMARGLKKQYQALGVPVWHREGPLLYTVDERLLFVPGLGIEASQRAEPGQPQWQLRWMPDTIGP